DPADLPGRRVLFGEAAAGLGRSGHPCQPHLLHGQRLPLWPAGHQRRATVGGLCADDRLRGGADRAGAVAAASRRGHAELTSVPFSDYIVFVDESGDHAMGSIDEGYPLFVLSCCLISKRDYVATVVPAM